MDVAIDEVLLTKDASGRRPGICRVGDTGFAVMWTGADDSRVFGHRLDATGHPVGDEFSLGTPGAGGNRSPLATPAGDDARPGFAVASIADRIGVSVEFLEPPGDPGPARRVNPGDAAVSTQPGLAQLADGSHRLVAAWSIIGGGVAARLLTPFGEPIGPQLIVSAAGTVARSPVRVIGLDSGQFVVFWQAGQDAEGTTLANFRVYTSDGEPLGPVIPAQLPMHSGELDAAALHPGPDGGDPAEFVVVHSTFAPPGTPGPDRLLRAVGGPPLAAPGHLLTTNFDHAIARTPAIAALSGRRYVAVWTVEPVADEGVGIHVRATIATPDHTPPEAFHLSQSGTANQTRPVVTTGTFDGTERIAFAWVDNEGSAPSANIRSIKTRVINAA